LICTRVCGPDQEMYEWVWEFRQIKIKWCKYRTQSTSWSQTPGLRSPLITSNSPLQYDCFFFFQSYFIQFFPKPWLFPGTGCFAKPCWYNLLQGLPGRWSRLWMPGDSPIFPTLDTDSNFSVQNIVFQKGHFGLLNCHLPVYGQPKFTLLLLNPNLVMTNYISLERSKTPK